MATSIANAVHSTLPREDASLVWVDRAGRRWYVTTLLIFVGLASIVTAHHELWHDELQQWGIAVSSQTPWDVVRNLRYESTPALWHSLLYVITRFTHNPAAMQVFHVMLATAAAAVFLACAPFGRIYKTLFVLGYWPLFEYAVISRHYVLGEL